MLLLSRRQTRAALAAGAGAAVYLAASEIGKDRLKMTGLFVLASASMAGMVTAQSSAKAKNVEKRFNHLLTNGGTFGGNVTVVGTTNAAGTFQIGGAPLSIPGTHRALMNWAPNTHQGSSPGTYSPSFTDNTVSRVNDLIDQLSFCSDRADYILTELQASGLLA